MKQIYFTLTLVLSSVGLLAAQTPALGLGATDAYLYKYIMPKKSIMGGASLSLEDVMGAAVAFASRSEPELGNFSAELDAKIKRMAPKWLREAGAKRLAIMDTEAMSEEALESYRQFYLAYMNMQGYSQGNKGLMFGKNKMQETSMVYLKDGANKTGDLLDRDYVMIIDFVGSHWVKEKNKDKPVDMNDLSGWGWLTVSIFDTATGLSVVSQKKEIGNAKTAKKIEVDDIMKDAEKLVAKAYAKFEKEMSR